MGNYPIPVAEDSELSYVMNTVSYTNDIKKLPLHFSYDRKKGSVGSLPPLLLIVSHKWPPLELDFGKKKDMYVYFLWKDLAFFVFSDDWNMNPILLEPNQKLK